MTWRRTTCFYENKSTMPFIQDTVVEREKTVGEKKGNNEQEKTRVSNPHFIKQSQPRLKGEQLAFMNVKVLCQVL